jgi:poly(hydroxyalkanoate) depolymerase family esterase
LSSLLKKIVEATRLTGRGQLAEATAAIQRALGAEGPVAAPSAEPATRVASIPVEAFVVDAPVRVDPERTPVAPDAPEPAARTRPAAAPAGTFTESSFTGAGGTRSFKLFVPGGFEGQTLPLIVMLHGCTQDPDDFAAGTRMNALAQEAGFLVLYPAQAPRSNAHKCWNWFVPADQRRGAGEPDLLAGMARHVMQTHGIDPDRVYVAGLSAGAAMAAILAREYPDLFAAAGIHSGLPAGAARDVGSAFSVMKSGASAVPTASAPVIVFHGDADATVTAANGDAVIASVLGALPQVARTDGAGTARGRAFRHTVWRAEKAAADTPSVAEQWLVAGAGHAWSGGAPAGSYTDATGPDASREMLRFFLEHPRRPLS